MSVSLLEILSVPPFLAAIVFGAAGVIGLFRFSDPYARLQAGGLCGTTAVFSMFIAALLLSPDLAVTARVIVITLFFLISAPTGAHIVARFAWNAGIHPPKTGRPLAGQPRREAP